VSTTEIGSMRDIEIRERFIAHGTAVATATLPMIRALIVDLVTLSAGEATVALDGFKTALTGPAADALRVEQRDLMMLIHQHAERYLPFQEYMAAISQGGAEGLVDIVDQFKHAESQPPPPAPLTPAEAAALLADEKTDLRKTLQRMIELLDEPEDRVEACMLVGLVRSEGAPPDADLGRDHVFVHGNDTMSSADLIEELHSACHEVLNDARAPAPTGSALS
jgi:hypothetical protein